MKILNYMIYMLIRMKNNEAASRSKLKQYKEEREAAKAEINRLLGRNI